MSGLNTPWLGGTPETVIPSEQPAYWTLPHSAVHSLGRYTDLCAFWDEVAYRFTDYTHPSDCEHVHCRETPF